MNNTAIRLRLKILYYTLAVWGRRVKILFYYTPKAWVRQTWIRLGVVWLVLHGESVCFRARFIGEVSFSGKGPEMVQCSYWQESGIWLYTNPPLSEWTTINSPE